MLVILATVSGSMLSLVVSADPLDHDQRRVVEAAIAHLERSGFHARGISPQTVAVFRSNDNWLNASVEKENAYAATNFPFEIVTVYPIFFAFLSTIPSGPRSFCTRPASSREAMKRSLRIRLEKQADWMDLGSIHKVCHLARDAQADKRIHSGDVRLRRKPYSDCTE
jgi:hypothetical protein